MKYALLIIGVILVVASAVSIGRYLLDYQQLADYGKGYIWGKGFLLIVGMVMTYLGYKKMMNQNPV